MNPIISKSASIIKVFILLLFVAILLNSCSSKLSGYKNFLAFDEYKLQGIGELSDNVKTHPYVSVQKSADTIRVIVHFSKNDEKEVVYVNKSDFWFSERIRNSDESEYEPGKTDISQSFIFQDTILQYDFILEDKIVVDKHLVLSTKNDEYQIVMNPEIYSKFENYESLKMIIKSISKMKYADSEICEKIGYMHFTKTIINNRLFFYEKDPYLKKYKKGCLYKVYLLNSLGEYVLDHSINVTNDYLDADMKLPCE